LYASSEWGATKVGGGLYRLVSQQENVPPSSIHHWGDRELSDVTKARRAGLQATLLQPAKLTQYERVLESFAGQTSGLTSLMAGCGRFVRLSGPVRSAHDQSIVSVAAAVAAPVLIAYVLWVLQRAKKLSLKRLYFVSRDGYLLMRIAERLKDRVAMNCELRYLYGSRQAWHLASLSDKAGLTADWITVRAHAGVTIRDLLLRLDLSPEEIAAALRAVGIQPAEYDTRPDRELIDRFKAALARADVIESVLAKAENRRELALRYCEQEGLCSDRDWAIVDVGWRGRAQQSLAGILAHRGADVPRGFYFGLRSNACASDKGLLEAYMFDGREGGGFVPNVPAIDAVLEIFCTAPHGMVSSYQALGDKIVPVLRQEKNDMALRWGMATLHEAVCSVADHLATCPWPFESEVELRPAAVALLESFWNEPSYQESLAWGGYQLESDQATNDTTAMARPYSLAEGVRYIVRGRVSGRPWDWRSASLKLTPMPTRLLFKSISRVRQWLAH
jgi:hypothetical protein